MARHGGSVILQNQNRPASLRSPCTRTEHHLHTHSPRVRRVAVACGCRGQCLSGRRRCGWKAVSKSVFLGGHGLEKRQREGEVRIIGNQSHDICQNDKYKQRPEVVHEPLDWMSVKKAFVRGPPDQSGNFIPSKNTLQSSPYKFEQMRT